MTNFVVGRLGDKLHFYIEAKWVAKHYNIPFYLTPFPEAAYFALSNQDHPLPEEWRSRVRETSLPSEIHPGSGLLYTIAYRFQYDDWKSPFDICLMKSFIEDRAFMEELRMAFQPMSPVNKVSLPSDKQTVALHYRTGGGFDPSDSAHYWPFKFLPFEFYVAGLERLQKQLENDNIYVHIFTDDPNPAAIAKKFQDRFPAVEFGYRKELNRHNLNVLEDLFGMAACKYLVRGSSHLPQIAQIIGSHSVVIFPLLVEGDNYAPEIFIGN